MSQPSYGTKRYRSHAKRMDARGDRSKRIIADHEREGWTYVGEAVTDFGGKPCAPGTLSFFRPHTLRAVRDR